MVDRPRRLPSLEGTQSSAPTAAQYLPEEQKKQLLTKYGDLTRPSVLPPYVSHLPLGTRAVTFPPPVSYSASPATLQPRDGPHEPHGVCSHV